MAENHVQPSSASGFSRCPPGEKFAAVPHRTLFLAEPLDLAERLEVNIGYTAAPTGRARSCSPGAIVFNVAIDTDFPGHIRFDGHTLVVRIPIRFQRRSGCKRIVAPDGSEIAPTIRPQPDGTLVKALARAWRWQRMLDQGVYASVSEIGDTENISKSYVSRILRLALLAPDIVEAILAGSTEQSMMLEQLDRPLPASWAEQREHLC